MGSYPAEVEQKMRVFYNTLNEKDRRRYAGIEAIKFGHGGIIYIAEILGCCRHTVSAAINELEMLPEECSHEQRIRAEGGGRNTFEETHPQIDEAFLEVLRHHTAGDPQNEKLIWTNLTLKQIAEKLKEEHQIEVSNTVIKKLLKKYNFKRRKAQKKKTLKAVEGRNEQFENIAQLKEEFLASNNPIISIDTKKKN